jgi:hypothetical protein
LCAHVAVHVFADLCELGDDLDAGRANANHSNTFFGEVILLIPSSGVNKLALELLEAFNAWPFPVAVSTLDSEL